MNNPYKLYVDPRNLQLHVQYEVVVEFVQQPTSQVGYENTH